MKVFNLALIIAFLALINVVSACGSCSEIISTADACVYEHDFPGSVAVLNVGHYNGTPMMISAFGKPNLKVSQIKGGLMLYGDMRMDLALGDGSGPVSTYEPVLITTGKKYASQEVSVTVKVSQYGITVTYNDIGIEVFQHFLMPNVRIRSVSGAPISIIGPGVAIKNVNHIWAFDP